MRCSGFPRFLGFGRIVIYGTCIVGPLTKGKNRFSYDIRKDIFIRRAKDRNGVSQLLLFVKRCSAFVITNNSRCFFKLWKYIATEDEIIIRLITKLKELKKSKNWPTYYYIIFNSNSYKMSSIDFHRWFSIRRMFRWFRNLVLWNKKSK